MRRNSKGKIDPEGKIWAVPYRWGSMVIAYKKSKFEKLGLAPVEVIFSRLCFVEKRKEKKKT